MNPSGPMHYRIALDIARSIVGGKYPVGTKISGRSVLSGNYSVSPETVRKGMALLREFNVLTFSQGREGIVESVEQAKKFLAHSDELQNINSLKQEAETLITRLNTILDELFNRTDILKNLAPFNPIKVLISPCSSVIGKTLSELHVQERTGATVVAIQRGAEVIISPLPSEKLNPGDEIIVVGQGELLNQRLIELFNPDDLGSNLL